MSIYLAIELLGFLGLLVGCSAIGPRATIDEVENVSPSSTDHPDWGTPYEKY